MRALCMWDGLAPPFTLSGNADNCLITVMVPVSDTLQDLTLSKGWDPLLKNQEGRFFSFFCGPQVSTFLLILPWAQRHSLGCADCSIPGPSHIWPSPLLCLDSDPHWAKGSSEGLSWGLKPLAYASHQLSLSKHKFKDKLLRIWGMQLEGLKSQGRACFCLRGLAASSAHQPLSASVPGMRQTWGSYHFQAVMWAPSPAACCPLTCVTQLQLLEIRHPRYTASAG